MTFTEPVHEVALKRGQVLEALTESVHDKPSLVESLDVSRSTVDRAVRELEIFSLITRRDGGFAATASGRVVARALTSLEQRLDSIAALRPVLDHVDPGDGLPPAVLEGGVGYLESTPAPDNVAFQLTKRLEHVESMETVTRTISRTRSTKRFHDLVVNRGVSLRGIYAVDLASFLNAWERQDRHRMAETGNYEAFVTNEETPFTVYLCHYPEHAEAMVFVYDDDEDLVGVVVNDSEAAVEWAAEYFDRFREGAIEITEQF